ncbi:uncharacterized protein LOC124921058 [Impatiens glandulifera]|uniref:uncharacterized protein LOC124921058 n=1 Tax=Impatiens glandulifera TaxID=253017 RepID=UPI001FB18463|nr:uncharacterized protein LOC124921058 [Impatiens glandulifera]
MLAPSISPTVSSSSFINNLDTEEEHWRNFDSTVNAVSFGFIATAVLVSMFLAMAIFERLLRPRPSSSSSSSSAHHHLDLEAFNAGKLHYPPSPNNCSSPPYAKDMSSVLMPGEEVPTFIAHSVPAG